MFAARRRNVGKRTYDRKAVSAWRKRGQYERKIAGFLSGGAFAAGYVIGPRLALLPVAVAPVAAAWFFWFRDAMGRAGYTDLADPARLDDLQLASISYAIVLSSMMFILFLVRGMTLARRKARAVDVAGSMRPPVVAHKSVGRFSATD